MFKAYRLQQIDKERDMHMQAWLNHQVTAMKEQGKKQVPVYKNFKEFYDYEKRLEEIEGAKESKLTPRMRKMARIAAQLNAKGGR